MAARPYWSGNLRLALVTIPVQLFSATRSGAKLSFHQIHQPSGKRIRYEKTVPGLGPVDTDEIVKGYEVEKNKYVLLSDEELDEVKLEAKKTIDLVQFVKQSEIGPLYFDRPFFLAPDEDSDGESYVVLREALRKTGMVALGQMVVRGKSSIVALKPCAQGLLIETLRYPDEIRKTESFFGVVPEIDPDKELIELAEELIGRRTGRFDPAAFEDSYTAAVRELIQAKLEHREPEEIETVEPGAKVIDLMEALKRSVKDKEAGQKTKPSRGGAKSGSSAAGKSAKSSGGKTKSGGTRKGKSTGKAAKKKQAA